MNAYAQQNNMTDGGNGRRWGLGRIIVWSVPAALLMIPLVAMQFSEQVDWSLFDFVIMGGLMYGLIAAYEFLAKLSGNTLYRAGAGLALLMSFLLTWINGAVGIIGDGPINLLYFGVLLVGVFGAAIARFQPTGMANTLFAMAFVQMLIPTIAFIWNQPMGPGVLQVFVLNGVFAVMFGLSGFLFQEAGRGEREGSAA